MGDKEARKVRCSCKDLFSHDECLVKLHTTRCENGDHSLTCCVCKTRISNLHLNVSLLPLVKLLVVGIVLSLLTLLVLVFHEGPLRWLVMYSYIVSTLGICATIILSAPYRLSVTLVESPLVLRK